MPAGIHADTQHGSQGISSTGVVDAALEAAEAEPGLSWLDVGCGTGDLARRILADAQPLKVTATDLLDWLADDLRPQVELELGPAEVVLERLEPADRVLLVEVLEHLESPWTTLRGCARKVKRGGRLIVTTPNVMSLRHRVELLWRGQLTSFRPSHPSHLTPALPHVIEAVLAAEGLEATTSFVALDLLPGGRVRWPRLLAPRAPVLSHKSLLVVGRRPA